MYSYRAWKLIQECRSERVNDVGFVHSLDLLMGVLTALQQFNEGLTVESAPVHWFILATKWNGAYVVNLHVFFHSVVHDLVFQQSCKHYGNIYSWHDRLSVFPDTASQNLFAGHSVDNFLHLFSHLKDMCCLISWCVKLYVEDAVLLVVTYPGSLYHTNIIPCSVLCVYMSAYVCVFLNII